MKRTSGYIIVLAAIILAGCTLAPPQDVTAETIGTVDQTSQVINNTGMDFKTLIMFAVLAGWAIPSPAEMLGWGARLLLPFKWW